MTFGRVLKLLAVAALTVLMVAPADAGPFRGDASVIRGARVAGRVRIDEARTASFSVEIRQLQGIGAEGAISLLPSPPAPDAGPQPNRNTGCVEIDAGSFGKDKGCIVRSATVTIDPAMLSGQIVLGFESQRFEGDLIDVTLLLEGGETIAPSIEDGDPPVVAPNSIEALNEILLTRDATVLAGSVRSRGLGFRGTGLGGPVISVTRSQMFTGLNGFLDADLSCLVSVSNNCVNIP